MSLIEINTIACTNEINFSAISVAMLKDEVWAFGKLGQPPFTAALQLRGNGQIGGYSHVNERHWILTEDRLEVLDEGGKPTSCYKRALCKADGGLLFLGHWNGDESGDVCYLEQVTELYSLNFYNEMRRIAEPLEALHVVRRGGLGDVLMVTPALRDFKKQRPETIITFYTDYVSAVEGLPYIDRVCRPSEAPANAIQIDYERTLPPKFHIAKRIGHQLGLILTDTRPDCIVLDSLVEKYKFVFSRYPRPHVGLLRRASRFTPNKSWSFGDFDRLIESVCDFGSVVEIGEYTDAWDKAIPVNYIDLRSRTSLSDLIALIAAIDVLVCPVSGPLHISAACRTPAVVIAGGYEHSEHTLYSGNIILSADLPCSPCWLRTPCPIDLACMKAISVEAVVNAVRRAWGSA